MSDFSPQFQEGYNESYVTGKEKVAKHFSTQVGNKQRGTDRLPPGQRLVSSFPVLDLGIHPSPERIPLWKLQVDGLMDTPLSLKLDELRALDSIEQTRDFHCVTRWSAYDLEWKGVLLTTLAELAGMQPEANHIIFTCFDGYSTNVPLEEALTDEGMVAFELNHEPLPILHGGPIRGLIPHLYGWKSAKFLTKITFGNDDQPGFWETRGYNNHGDPWAEERYSDS